MFKLLEIELRKLLPYRAFWLAVVAYGLLMPGLFISLYKLGINARGVSLDFNFYNFPEVWHNSAFIASWFNMLLYFFVLLVVTNEYQFRTIRQNVIDGLSRWQYLAGKVLLLLVFAICSTGLVAVLGLLSGMYLSETQNTAEMFNKTEYLGLYFVQLLGYLSFALLIGTIVRKQGMSIIIFLGYSLVFETILRYRVLPSDWGLGPYLPLQALGAVIPNPLMGAFTGVPMEYDLKIVGASLGYTLLFILLSGWVISKRDL